MATVPSCKANCAACTPTNNCWIDASVGRFGSVELLVKKLSHAAVPRSSPSETSATWMLRRICRFSSGLVVESDRDRKGARLRVVEIIHSARAQGARDGATQIGLGIVPGVVRPGVQIAAGKPDIDARESDGALHPGLVERVAHGDLAQLDEAAVLDARLVDPDEGAGRDEPVPVLSDRHGGPGARTRDGSVEPAALPEGLLVPAADGPRHARGPLLRVLVDAVAPQSALGAVPDLPAVPDVQQAGQLELLVAECAANAAGPVVLRVLDDPQVRIRRGEAVGPDVERALWLARAHGAHGGRGSARAVHLERVGRHTAPQEPRPEQHAKRLARHSHLVIEISDRDEVD